MLVTSRKNWVIWTNILDILGNTLNLWQNIFDILINILNIWRNILDIWRNILNIWRKNYVNDYYSLPPECQLLAVLQHNILDIWRLPICSAFPNYHPDDDDSYDDKGWNEYWEVGLLGES